MSDDGQLRKKLFISHSSADKAFVNRLIKELGRHDVPRPWYDTFELPPGTADIQAEIETAIAQSSAFVLVLSPASADSHWVAEEVRIAEEHEVPVLVLLHGTADGGVVLGRGRPHIARLLNAGRRKVFDFDRNFEAALLDLLDFVAPTAGAPSRTDHVLRAILEDGDPDAAEVQMSFAALDPASFVERILPLLPKLRDDVRLQHRAGRLVAHIGEAAVGPILRSLLLFEGPEGDPVVQSPVTPTTVDPDTGMAAYMGSAFSDFVRWLILSGGNQVWAAQIGASHCLVAAAEHDPLLHDRIERALGGYLGEVMQEIPNFRDQEIESRDWDRLRMALQTVRDMGPSSVTDSWLISELISRSLWGDHSEEAARKIGSYVVTTLSRFRTAEACDRLLRIAETEKPMRAIWFENAHGVMADNPWKACFVPFGNRAVDGLLRLYKSGDGPFAPFARLNLSQIANPRGQAVVIDFLQGGNIEEHILHSVELMTNVGRAGDPVAGTALLELYVTGQLDAIAASETWSGHLDGVADAVATATDDRLAVQAATQLSASTSLPVQARLARSIGKRRLTLLYDTLERWRLESDNAYIRACAATSLAEAGFFRNAEPVHRQLASAEPDIERPMLGLALALLGDSLAEELLADGLQATFRAFDWGHHEEYGDALQRLGTPEGLRLRAKWYRRI